MQKKKLGWKVSTVALGAFLAFGQAGVVSASAEGTEPETESVTAEKIYYDDVYYGDGIFHGYGTMTAVNYYVYCDEVRTENYVARLSAPSYGSGNSALSNGCGAISGTNVVVYYDQMYTNLLVDFEPGMIISAGYYDYYPDLSWPQTVAAHASLYQLMKIPEVGGTTSANFRSGLKTFINNAGYGCSYSTFYSGETTIDYTTFQTAIAAGKVGVIMCSEYNFITSMSYDYSESGVYIVKNQSTTGHIMMVYGYKTLGYYTNGVKIAEKTFLMVSSGYQTGEQGFMELNDFSVIDEAWVVNLS